MAAAGSASVHTVPEEDVLESFTKSLGMVLFSELGDKTFFMAALLAMRYGRSPVFLGAWGALAVMTCLSTALGWAAPQLIPDAIVHWLAVVLFFMFGIRMSYQAAFWQEPEVSELDEVEAELKERKLMKLPEPSPAKAPQDRAEVIKASSKPDKPVVVRQRIAVFASTEVDKQLAQGADVCDDEKKEKPEAPQSRGVLEHVKEALCKLFTPIVVESFLLTFVAEWGDRSQMATIGLAMAGNAVGVNMGGVLGHAICTGMAVAGGKRLAGSINEQHLMWAGALLFIGFGTRALMELLAA